MESWFFQPFIAVKHQGRETSGRSEVGFHQNLRQRPTIILRRHAIMAAAMRGSEQSSNGTDSQSRVLCQNLLDTSSDGSVSFNDRPAVTIPDWFRPGECIKSESRHTEFKKGPYVVFGRDSDGKSKGENNGGSGNPTQSVVDKYIVGFLNSEGGVLYIGVGNEDCSVVGIVLSNEQKRKFEDDVAMFATRTEPSCADKYVMKFVEVRPNCNPNGQAYVIIIDVAPQKGLKVIYRNSEGQIVVRSNVINRKLRNTEESYEFEKKAWEDDLKNQRQLLESKRRQIRELEEKYKKRKHDVDVLENDVKREIEEKETEIEQMKEQLEEHRSELAREQENYKTRRENREENIARFHAGLDEVRNQALEDLQKEYKQAKEAIKKWDKKPEASSDPCGSA